MKEYLDRLQNFMEKKALEVKDKVTLWTYEHYPKEYIYYPQTYGFLVPPEVEAARERMVDRNFPRTDTKSS